MAKLASGKDLIKEWKDYRYIFSVIYNRSLISNKIIKKVR